MLEVRQHTGHIYYTMLYNSFLSVFSILHGNFTDVPMVRSFWISLFWNLDLETRKAKQRWGLYDHLMMLQSTISVFLKYLSKFLIIERLQASFYYATGFLMRHSKRAAYMNAVCIGFCVRNKAICMIDKNCDHNRRMMILVLYKSSYSWIAEMSTAHKFSTIYHILANVK